MTFSAHGILAPWIPQLAGEHPKTLATSLWTCEACGFASWREIHSESSLDSLYKNYRSRKYLTARRGWEPWISQTVMESRLPGTKEAALVRDKFESLLAPFGESILKKVADVGGDRGQFFPRHSSVRILLDPSNLPLEPGIGRAERILDLDPDVSLIILGCVLAHLPDPRGFLIELATRCPQAAILISTASDLPKFRKFHGSERYQTWLEWLVARKTPLVILDFLSGIAKQYGVRIPRFGVLKCSEHLHFFSQKSLEELLGAIGHRVVKFESDSTAHQGYLRTEVSYAVSFPSPEI